MCDAEYFEDEIHPRLRWSHRGLVGMANNGSKNSNDSQFFVTLGALNAMFDTVKGISDTVLAFYRSRGRIAREAYVVWTLCW